MTAPVGIITSRPRQAILAQDSFNRADTSTGLGNADVGGAYTRLPGYDQWCINSNLAKCGQVSVGMGFAYTGGNVQNVSLSVQYADAPSNPRRGFMGVSARLVDGGNYYVLHGQSGSTPQDVQLKKVIGGVTVTQLGHYTTNSDTCKLTLVCNGSSIQGWVDDVKRIDVTDTEFPNPGKYGLMFWTSSGWSDPSLNDYLALGI